MTCLLEKLPPEIQKIMEPTLLLIQDVTDEVIETYNWLGREVADWSDDNFDPRIAQIVQDAFYALPYALGYLFFPITTAVTALSAYALHKAEVINVPVELQQTIVQGFAFGATAEVVKDAILFGLTGNPVMAIGAVLSAATAVFLFQKAESLRNG